MPSETRLGTRLRGLVAVLLGALALLSVGLVQGSPSAFYDTDDYYLHGRMIAQQAGLPAPPERFDPESGVSIVHRRMTPDPRLAFTWYGARSPFYSALFYGLERLGTLWAVAAAQALAMATVLLWLAQTGGRTRWGRTYAILVAVLTLGSSLPFFVSFAMPDVFAGLTLAVAGLIAVYGAQMSAGRRLASYLMMTVAMVFHRSHVIDGLAVGLLVLCWPGLVSLEVGARRRGAAIAACAVAALALLAGADQTARLANGGMALRTPPFLAVRVLADGPGRLRLREVCGAQPRYALCAFKGLPLDNTDDMLSSDDPKLGIFRVSPYAVREAVAREETAFVIDAVLHHPLRQVLASIRNAAVQTGLFQVDEPLLTRSAFADHWFWAQTRLPALLDRADLCRRGAACIAAWPALPLKVWHGLVLLAAMAVILLRSSAAGRADADPEAARARSLALVFLIALFLNGAVCGALSGPFARYEARVVWLIPAAAVLLELSLRRRGREGGVAA
jgi:hypothetical protein